MKQLLAIFFVLATLHSASAENGDAATYNQGVAAQKKGDLPHAIDLFSASAKSSASDIAFKSIYNIGCILLEQKKFAEAEDYFAKAIKINGNDYNAKYNYSYSKLKQTAAQSTPNTEQASSETKHEPSKQNAKQSAQGTEIILKTVKNKEQSTLQKLQGKPRIVLPASKKPW
jgi:tetratricopeptide (TPR) repeat protein